MDRAKTNRNMGRYIDGDRQTSYAYLEEERGLCYHEAEKYIAEELTVFWPW